MKLIDFEVTLANLNDDVKKLYTIIRPSVKVEDIECEGFEEGVINSILKLDDSKNRDPLIIRSYNLKMNAMKIVDSEDFDISKFQNRALELAALKKASELGITVELVATYKNGFIYKFIDGDINSVELYDREVAKKTAIKMARLHRIDIDGLASKSASILKQYEQDKEFNVMQSKIEEMQRKIESKEFQTIPLFSELEKEAKRLHEIVLAHDAYGKTCFCHNDLNMSNLLIDKKTKDPIFIDFEWSDTNFQMFDIAYHLINMANKFTQYFKPELVPSDDFIRDWLRAYYEESNRLDGIVMSKEGFDVLIENGLKKVLVIMLSVRLILVTRAMFVMQSSRQATESCKDYCVAVYTDFLKHKDDDLKMLKTLQN